LKKGKGMRKKTEKDERSTSYKHLLPNRVTVKKELRFKGRERKKIKRRRRGGREKGGSYVPGRERGQILTGKGSTTNTREIRERAGRRRFQEKRKKTKRQAGMGSPLLKK